MIALYTWSDYEPPSGAGEQDLLAAFEPLHRSLLRWFEFLRASVARKGIDGRAEQDELGDASALAERLAASRGNVVGVGVDYSDKTTGPGAVLHLGFAFGTRDRADPALPPHMARTISGYLEWDDAFCNGLRFGNDRARDVYAQIIRGVRDEMRAIRIVDGEDLYQFKDPYGFDEGHARFVYYRDPVAFVRSFLLLRGLEGDQASIVTELHRLADSDTITNEHYRQNQAGFVDSGVLITLKGLESDPRGPGRFRRLRFEKNGGVSLERGRFAVGNPRYYIDTQCDPQLLLETALLDRGLVSRRERPIPKGP